MCVVVLFKQSKCCIAFIAQWSGFNPKKPLAEGVVNQKNLYILSICTPT